VRILGFRHDDLAGGGKTGISFEFADVPKIHRMNTKPANGGGWEASEMRAWLNDDFYQLLPSDLRRLVESASKRTNNEGWVSADDPSVVSATSDKLWLLAMSEVYGELSSYSSNVPSYPGVYDAEGTQYQLYADQGVTTSNYSFCRKSGADWFWWLRSPHARYSYSHLYEFGFLEVDSDGAWANYIPAYNVGVSPGFCF
jgi:hypothetical protein